MKAISTLACPIGLVAFLASCVSAQPPRIEGYQRPQDLGEVHERRASSKAYVAVSIATIAATVLDIETTHRALARCAECREANPLMRPFVERGRPATYALLGLAEGLTLWQARRHQRNGQRYWYLAPVVHAVSHGVAGGLNLRFAF